MRLIDADALKKYMDDCGWCDNCPDKKRLCEMDCRFPDFCTHEWQRVIDEQPTVPAPRWRRVDELPEPHKNVLIRREDVQREIQASFDGGAFRWQDGQDLMDRINAIPAAPRWVSIDDELPKEREWVLVWHTGYATAKKALFKDRDLGGSLKFDGGGGTWVFDGWSDRGGRVTHWMPLPEPPVGAEVPTL